MVGRIRIARNVCAGKVADDGSMDRRLRGVRACDDLVSNDPSIAEFVVDGHDLADEE